MPKTTVVICVKGVVTVTESDTGRVYPLKVNDQKRVRPRLDVIKVTNGNAAKVIFGEGLPSGASRVLSTTQTSSDPDEYFIVGGETEPEIIPDIGGEASQIDFYYDSQPYIEVIPPSGEEDDSVIITG